MKVRDWIGVNFIVSVKSQKGLEEPYDEGMFGLSASPFELDNWLARGLRSVSSF